MTQNISIALLDYNKGQLKGLPKMPEREFKPIAVLRDGIEVERFPSIKSACNALGLTSAGVCNTLAGRISNHRGYTFKYL